MFPAVPNFIFQSIFAPQTSQSPFPHTFHFRLQNPHFTLRTFFFIIDTLHFTPHFHFALYSSHLTLSTLHSPHFGDHVHFTWWPSLFRHEEGCVKRMKHANSLDSWYFCTRVSCQKCFQKCFPKSVMSRVFSRVPPKSVMSRVFSQECCVRSFSHEHIFKVFLEEC